MKFLAHGRAESRLLLALETPSDIVRRALVSAVEWGYLAQLPTFPRSKVPDPDWDHLNLGEMERLLAAARDGRDRLLLMFALHTGARAGEQLAVEWADIDWTKRIVYFKRARTRGETGPTKSGKKREVPLTRTLLATLKEVSYGPLPG